MNSSISLISLIFFFLSITNCQGFVPAKSYNGSIVSRQNGANFLSSEWSFYRYNSSESAGSLQLLRNTTNTTYIALTFTWYQWSIYTPGPIYPREDTPTDDELADVISQAHDLGMKVMMRPLVDPDWNNPANSDFVARRLIGSNWTYDSPNWNIWFDSYQNFMYKYANLSQILGADEFCVGGELDSTINQTKLWTETIDGIRSRYDLGPLVYAADWGTEVEVTFWDSLDYIGVDAYYPLDPLNLFPTVDDLIAAWKPIMITLENLSAKYQLPVIFPEIGYCSKDFTNVLPFMCEFKILPTNYTSQQIAYEAMFQVFYNKTWFHGVFWWDWLTQPRGGYESYFSPALKPAGDVMLNYYNME